VAVLCDASGSVPARWKNDESIAASSTSIRSAIDKDAMKKAMTILIGMSKLLVVCTMCTLFVFAASGGRRWLWRDIREPIPNRQGNCNNGSTSWIHRNILVQHKMKVDIINIEHAGEISIASLALGRNIQDSLQHEPRSG
jgi:hypothetical protein